MADRKKRAGKALGSARSTQRLADGSSALLLKHTRLRNDPEFIWVSGGRPYAEFSEGNGQPQNDGTWGLWYSPARPLPRLTRTTRRG